MKKRKFLVCMFSFSAIIILIIGMFFFIKSSEKWKPLKETGEKNVMVLNKFIFANEKHGRQDWKLKAEVARSFFDRKEIEIKGIEGEYESKEGTFVSFKAKEGNIDVENERCSVLEPKMQYNRLYHFETSAIEIDFKNGITRTERPLSIVGQNLTLKGIGLLGKLKEGIIGIEREVSGSISSENGSYRFRSDRFIYDSKRDVYILEGKVKIEGSNMNVSSEKVSIFNKDGTMERMEAKGVVKLRMDKIKAQSGNLLYDFKEGKIFMKDYPLIIRDNMITRGDIIVYDKKNETLYVKTPNLKIEKEKNE